MVGGGKGGGGGCGGANAGRGGARRCGCGQPGLCQPAEPTAARGGEPERGGALFADAGRSVGPRGAPKLGPVPPALFDGEKERLNRNCSTDNRSWFNSQMPSDILPQNATTESREVRVSDTSHLTQPAEIQNSLALAK